MSELEPIVSIQEVTYTHWNQDKPTLSAVSLTLQPGTLNVLVGPGGSGKSTLCDLLNGRIPKLLGGKLEGKVLIQGMDTSQTEVKELSRHVGSVSQDPETMFATLYVEDEIAFGPENLLVDPQEIKQTVEDLLVKTHLLPQRNHLVWQLSGGQVQQLGLATALAMKPALIILDEPTANLDPIASRSVYELVLSLREQGMTILLVIRELDEFLAQADQLLVLKEGRMLAAGKPDQVLRDCGQEMIHELGVWLPETSEIGLGLRDALCLPDQPIPITIPETIAMLQNHNLLAQPILLEKAESVEQAAKPALISGRQLNFRYGNGFHALKEVSFDVFGGEMLAIVGRNGAGKSTLSKLLVGLLKPQQGSLTLFDKPAQQWKVEDLATYIGLVFQNPEHQFLTDKVWDEIDYSLLARGITDEAIRKQTIEEALRRLKLEDVKTAHPFSLSAGMKRRLGVACMLVTRPAVLVVDEPTYGQDKQMTENLMQLMEEIRSEGIAVVMITHDMRLVQEYAQRIIVMSEGQILYEGQPQGLFQREELLAKANLRPTVLHELVQQLTEQGVTLSDNIRTTDDFLKALLQTRERCNG